MGRQLLGAAYFVTIAISTARVEVTATTLDDGLIELRWNESVFRGWNHRPQLVAAALSDCGHVVDRVRQRQVQHLVTLAADASHTGALMGGLHVHHTQRSRGSVAGFAFRATSVHVRSTQTLTSPD